jgi:uncharacterized membrane protein
MNTLNSVTIYGPIDRIFELAVRVEDWPKLLPHYRDVTVLQEDDQSRIVRMQCTRYFGLVSMPCQWVARQQVLKKEHKIRFTHLAGPARGMAVE